MIKPNQHASSFRDPSGYVFIDNDVLKRTINPIYFKQYKALHTSGFFEKLFKNNLLIKHEEILNDTSQIILKPEKIPFITYPYEWSFNQYKEAALLTLKIQKFSLEHHFSLKDASAFNVTFYNGKAIFIDTLSFDFYEENSPWRAYKQFISHFLLPLVLAHFHGSQMLKSLSQHLDGIPVKLAASMLPFKTKLNPFLYSNIHLLAKYEDHYNETTTLNDKQISLSKKGQLNIINSLYNYIRKLTLKESSEWKHYYNKLNYTEASFAFKSHILNQWIYKLKPKTLIDIGGNDGTFVRLLDYKADHALVCDIDHNAVDQNYWTIKKNKETHITPFILDVLNPSPSIGFNNKERASFLNRISNYSPKVTLALALIHHMSLTGNVSFEMSAQFFSSFSKCLIIEFPKREDSWVERLLNSKRTFKDHFNFYTISHFEESYKKYFTIVEKQDIKNTSRVLFLMKRND